MSTHYEWWAKAGGGPGYSHELKKDEYIKILFGLITGYKGIFHLKFLILF